MALEVNFEGEMEKLKQSLSKGRERQIDLIEFMQSCTVFFEGIESSLREGNTLEKDMVFRKLRELNGVVEGDVQRLCKESGKSEEEIALFVENPDNYAQETWQAIQKAHRRILRGRQLKNKKRGS